MNPIQVAILLMVAVTATGVVLNRDPLKQILALTFYGVLLALVFFSFNAPDVALSQIVIGAVVLPLMGLLALVRVRVEAEKKKEEKARKEAA